MSAHSQIKLDNLQPATWAPETLAMLRWFAGMKQAQPQPQFFAADPADVARQLAGRGAENTVVNALNGLTGLAWSAEQWAVHFGGRVDDDERGAVPVAVWQHVQAVRIIRQNLRG